MENKKYSLLISASEVSAQLNTPNWVFVDCRFSLADPEAGHKAYLEGHIPGAWYAHLDAQLSGPVIKGQTGRHPLPEVEKFKATCSAWGVGVHTQVVAYDDMGGAMAARLWWLLRWLGHEAVAVLDGGWPQWLAQGGATSTQLPASIPQIFVPNPQADMWVDSHFVQAVIQNPAYLVVDSRAPERYRGDVEPIDPVAGHIPGAANLPHFSNVGPNGCFLPKEVLRHKMEHLLQGHTPAHTIFYCGSGVTAAHNLLALEYAGLCGGKIYAGSWSEWITNPERPVERG